MKASAVAGKLASAVPWRRSPAVLFGTVALFLLAMGTISLWFGVLNNRLPLVRHGQITLVRAGYLVLIVDVPFAIFTLVYAEIELTASRVFRESPTRLHLACTFFAVLDAIRVYIAWAPTTARSSPEALTSNSFAGTIAFLILATATCVWNVRTSIRRPKARKAA
jgi:hypothetical protein